MLLQPHHDSELYKAGQLAPPGRYLRVGTFPPIDIVLDHVDLFQRNRDAVR